MFYKLDASRVTLREFWWETKLFAWVGLLVKLFKIRLRGSSDDLAVDSLRPFLLDEAKIPEDTLARFAPTLQQLRSLGFNEPLWHDEEDVFQATHNTLATLRHETGRAWVRVQSRTNFGRVPVKIKFFTTVVSRTERGFIATGNGKYDMAWPKTHDTVRFRHMAVDQVWAHHQKRMTEAVQPVSKEQLLDVAEEYHATLRDFHLARGVFQPLGEEEFALYSAKVSPPLTETGALSATTAPAATDATAARLPSSSTAPPSTPDLMEVATLDELRRLQNKKGNWQFSVAILLLSVLFFILYSRNSDRDQNWEYLGIIVGILLFHELGHYLAMKMFGYSNLKMFFIPGFGAAVSGRHYNAPAWKKVIVSLMGPLPGIAAGSVLLILYGLLHNELLYRIGFFAIIINAFNLIPVLPFDGGWVAHAALFSRHPKLDVGFRLVAALLLILIGITVPGTRFLPYIAVASLVALPVAHKLATIVSELRQLPGMGMSPDSQTIPPDTARLILARIRQQFKRNLNAKLAAQHVASVFESLNARPPSVGVTIGLLSLHAGGFVLALVACVVAVALHSPAAFRRPPIERPAYAVTPDQIESTGQSPTESRNTVIMRFKNDRTAHDVFATFHPPRPASRFAQTLFISFTPQEIADQRAVFSRYERIAADIFVESSQMHAIVEMTFKLPDTETGREAFEDLDLYLQGSGWGLIPPWAAEAEWPPQERASQTNLRRLLKELQTTPVASLEDQKQRRQQISAARRRGDTAEVERLESEAKQAVEDAERSHQQQLQERYGHPDFIQNWAKIRALKDWTQRQARLKQEIAPQLGQWPAGKSNDTLVTSGSAFRPRGGGVSVYCRFAQTDTGLLAMTRWLFSRGASDVRYRVRGYATRAGDANLDED